LGQVLLYPDYSGAFRVFKVEFWDKNRYTWTFWSISGFSWGRILGQVLLYPDYSGVFRISFGGIRILGQVLLNPHPSDSNILKKGLVM
jgi:predicted Rdx family selenoprotein